MFSQQIHVWPQDLSVSDNEFFSSCFRWPIRRWQTCNIDPLQLSTWKDFLCLLYISTLYQFFLYFIPNLPVCLQINLRCTVMQLIVLALVKLMPMLPSCEALGRFCLSTSHLDSDNRHTGSFKSHNVSQILYYMIKPWSFVGCAWYLILIVHYCWCLGCTFSHALWLMLLGHNDNIWMCCCYTVFLSIMLK